MKEENAKKSGRGGARPGAGRPKSDDAAKNFGFRASGEMRKLLDGMEHRTEFITSCIQKEMDAAKNLSGNREGHWQQQEREGGLEQRAEPDFTRIGSWCKAENAKAVEVPFVDVKIAAGFPIPLDSDERAQDINMLDMICPNPEDYYMIRVSGNSMIDADVQDGDIIVVDRTNLNPDERDICVCELNGDYTLKHVMRRNGETWLQPRNPDYPRFMLEEGDTLRVWGTLAWVLHKAR